MASQGAPSSPRSYTISNLKSKILNIAQTSVYLVKLQPPSKVASFIQGEGRGFNYSLQGEDLELSCCEASLPGSTLATHEVTNDFHGVTEKMAYRRMYDETTDFTFYVDYNYNINEFFEGWMDYVAGEGTTFDRNKYKEETTHFRMNYPDDYKTNIYITKFEKDDPSKTVLYYTFVGAFPTSIISTPISYEESQLLKMTVSFSYMRYVRERKTFSRSLVNPNPNSPGNPELKTSVEPIPFNTDKLDRSRSGDAPVYYNNKGVNAQDSTNFGNFFNGKRVDQGVFGSEAQA